MKPHYKKRATYSQLYKLITSLTLVFGFLWISSTEVEARKISRVIIDAGHGGRDSGATRYGIHEKYLALKVAKQVEKMLKAKGMPVTMTRTRDKFISLNDRAAIANRYSNAIFVSIHFNASTRKSLHGIETYYYGSQGAKLAAHVQLRLLSKLKSRNGGTRQRKDFAVLNKTKCPAILIECGYLSNYSERKKCMSYKYQYNCAKAIVDGIWAYKTYN